MGLFTPTPLIVKPQMTFVCTGNICRSAYAEKSMANWSSLNQKNSPPHQLIFDSAGTMGLIDEPMDSTAASIAHRYNYETFHKARRISEKMLVDGGFFICMAETHRKTLQHMNPRLSKRFLTLGYFSRINSYISENDMLQDKKLSWDKYVSILEASKQRVPLFAEGDDVQDPYKESIELHQAVYARIENLLLPVKENLLKITV